MCARRCPPIVVKETGDNGQGGDVMTRTGIIGLAGCLLCAPVAVHAQDAAPARVELPLRDVVLSNKAHRYAVPITVGGVAMDAGLDTGSVGLRILGRAVTSAQLDKTSHQTTYSYDSGTRLKGCLLYTSPSPRD